MSDDLLWVTQTQTVDAIERDVTRAMEANPGWRLLHVGMGSGGQTTLTYGWPWQPPELADDFDITVDIDDKPWSYLSPQQATVSVRFANGEIQRARASGPEPKRGRGPSVNHSGFSGVSPKDALAYAAAIRRAAEIAVTLSGPTGGGS